MSIAYAQEQRRKKEEEEKKREEKKQPAKVEGRQQKTQTNANKPVGTTSIPKDKSRTQSSAALSVRPKNLDTSGRSGMSTPIKEQARRDRAKGYVEKDPTARNYYNDTRTSRTEYRTTKQINEDDRKEKRLGIKGYSDSFYNRNSNYTPTRRKLEKEQTQTSRRNDSTNYGENGQSIGGGTISRIPGADDLPTMGVNQLGNLNDYVKSTPKDYNNVEIDSRKQAEEELENILHGNRNQMREDAAKDSNTLKAAFYGAGAGALGTIGDLAGISNRMKGKGQSTEGMSPDDIYNRAMSTGANMNAFNYNNADIGNDYDAYKDYVLGQIESGAVTPDDIQKMRDLEDLYTQKIPAKRLEEIGKDARAVNEGYASQNPIANMAGNLIPMILGNAALGATGVLNGAQGAASAINNPVLRTAAQQGVNLIPDLLVDTLPEMARNINEDKSAGEIAKAAALNVGLNAGANALFDFAPKAARGIADRLNASNIAKQATEEAPEVTNQVLKNLVEDPVPEVDQIAKQAEDARQAVSDLTENLPIANEPTQSVINSTVNNDLGRLRDIEIDKLAEAGNNPLLSDAYVDLIRKSTDSTENFNAALKNFQDIVNANGITSADNSINRLSHYVNGQVPDIDANVLGSITNNIDMIDNELAKLDAIGVPPTKNGSDWLSEAHTALRNYEDAVFNDGDISGAQKALNRALGNLDTQAKKLEGYDGAFSQWKGGGTLRGQLYSNTNQIPGAAELSPEKNAIVDDWLANEDQAKRFAQPANGMSNANNSNDIISSADDLPQNVDNAEVPDLKVSQTYTNTGKNGGGWNDAEYNKYTDPKDYLYETKSEVDSVNEATQMRRTEGRENFKDRVLQKERMSSVEMDGLMMEWREITEEARQIEANGGDASALWDESNRVFKKIREQSTNNAQALQALAKWSRNTPEGMLIEAENIVNGKVKVEKGELQKQLEKYLKKNHPDIEFSSEFEQQFLNLASQFKQYDPNSMQAKQIMSQIGQLVNSQVPNKLSEKVTAWLMDSMLGNFRTLITRNAGGNLGLAATEQVATRPLAASIDSLVAKKTGKRTQAGMSKAAISEYLGGMKKGLSDELTDLKTGLHTARTGENTLSNAISSNRHVFKNKILDKFDSLVKNGLSVGDRPFYEATYAQTLGDYYRLRGDMGPDIAKLTDDEFKEYAETAAHLNALAAVYQNDSALSKGMLDLKNSIGKISEGTLGVDVLSQFSMPFVKTPANVIDRAIDYSPVGLLRNAIRTTKEGGIGGANFDQNRFVNESARNIIGTGITLGGGAAAANGLMSGKYSDDKDEKKAQQDAGMQEYALNLPGNYQMDIGWVPILGSNMVAGAAAYNGMGNDDGSTLDNLYSGVAAGGNELFGQAAMQGAQRLFGGSNSYNSNEGIMENAKNTVMGGFSQAIPSLLRQTAQVADPYKRDVGNSNGGNYELNNVLNSIPGLRQNMLSPKIDSSGNPVLESQGRSIPSKILEDMILPGRITEVDYSPLDEEAARLSEATGNKYSYMPKANKKDLENDNIKLSNQQWEEYQTRYGQEMTNAGTAMMQTPEYSNMNDVERENAMSDIYSAVRTAINSEYKNTELKGASKAYAEGGIDAALDYVIYGNMVKDLGLQNNEKNRTMAKEEGVEGLQKRMDEKSNIDADGNGSYKQDEILNYINNGHQDEADRIWSEYYSGKKTISKNANGNYEISDSKTTANKSNASKQDINTEMRSYQQGGSVDLFNRPNVPTDDLKAAGWTDAGDGYATVHSSTYSNAAENDVRNFTPIQTDNSGSVVNILSPDELQSYAEAVIDGERNDDLGLQIGGSYPSIDKAVDAAVRIHELQEQYYSDYEDQQTTNNSVPTLNNSPKTSGLKKKLLFDSQHKQSNVVGSEVDSLPDAAPAEEETTNNSSDGLNWDLSNGYNLKNTKTYQRAVSAGVSDADFNRAWYAADADGNGYMKKAEAQAYVNTLPEDVRNMWYNILYKGR